MVHRLFLPTDIVYCKYHQSWAPSNTIGFIKLHILFCIQKFTFLHLEKSTSSSNEYLHGVKWNAYRVRCMLCLTPFGMCIGFAPDICEPLKCILCFLTAFAHMQFMCCILNFLATCFEYSNLFWISRCEATTKNYLV